MTKIYTFSRICTIAGICAAMCVFPCCKGSSGGTSGSGADDEEEVSGTEPGEEDEEQQPESEGPTSVKIPKTLLPSKVPTGTVEIDFGSGVLTMNIVQIANKDPEAWQAVVTGELDVPAMHRWREEPFRVSGMLRVTPIEGGVNMVLISNFTDGEVEFEGLRIVFNVPVADDTGERRGLVERPDAIQVRYGVPGTGMDFTDLSKALESGEITIKFSPVK